MSADRRLYQGLESNYEAEDLERRAISLRETGRYSAAAGMLTRAMRIKREALPGTEYELLDELGYTYLMSGDIQKALPLFQNAIELIEKSFYPDHFRVAPVLDHWALGLISVGELDKAELLVKKSLAIKQKSLLPNDSDVLETVRTLADLERRLGKYDEAETHLNQAYKLIAEATIAPIEEFLYEFALLKQAQGQLEAAERFYQQAIPIFAHRGGKVHRLGLILNSYADLLQQTGRSQNADKLRVEAEALLLEPPTLMSRQDIPGPVFFDRDLYAATIMH